MRVRGLDNWNQNTGGGLGGYVFSPSGTNNGVAEVWAIGGGATGMPHNVMQPYSVLNYIVKT